MHNLKAPVPLKFNSYLPSLAPRSKNAHKGDFGKILIIGGYAGFPGAVRLAGEAALRSGAGIVTIAKHSSHAHYLQASRPELIVHGVDSAAALTSHLYNATVIAIGHGLGQDKWSKELLQETLQVKDKPIVFDADVLNLMAKNNYPCEKHHLYTPHPGEAARLLQCKIEDIEANRLKALAKLTEKYAGIMVLKGSGSLIGQQQNPTFICQNGNPGMATAGMGDVLTGIIAVLIGQKIPLLKAACLGVLVHALAGDKAALEGERGLIASDIFPYLKTILNPK